MAKYIDAERLRAEVTKERKSIEGLFIEGDNNFYDGQDDAYNHVLALIDSLQHEQPEVDLEEVDLTEEINRYCGTRDVRPVPDFMETVARHFAKWQYQKDRAEFAKLKAKEWQDGYDDGYKRGLNARKEK